MNDKPNSYPELPEMENSIRSLYALRQERDALLDANRGLRAQLEIAREARESMTDSLRRIEAERDQHLFRLAELTATINGCLSLLGEGLSREGHGAYRPKEAKANGAAAADDVETEVRRTMPKFLQQGPVQHSKGERG